MEGIQVSLEKAGVNNNVSIIKINGYIDTITSSEVEKILDSVMKSGSFRIVVDLANVDYISSAGWGIFISEIKNIRSNNGDLKLVKMIPDVYEVFELLEFHHILKTYNSIEEAVKEFDNEFGLISAEPSQQPSIPSQEKVTKNQQFSVEQTNNIQEAIKKIVIQNPDYGAFRIKVELKSQNINAGWFEVRRYLKKLNLDLKEKRREFSKQYNKK